MSKVAIQGNASGTGTLTIAAPNTNTNRTLTLPDEAGTVLTTASSLAGDKLTGTVLPKGVPAFRAWLYNGGSNFTFANNVWTKIPLDTETFDTDSFFDNTTNYRFQPTIAGYYQIVLNGYISFSASGATVPQIAIYKNGSEHARAGNIHSSASSYGPINLTDLVYFNGSTDYVEGYVYYNGSSNLLLRNSNYTFMSGVLVRAD